MKKIFLLIISLTIIFQSFAQSNYFTTNSFYDLSLSSSGSQHIGALSWHHLHKLGKKKKFSIGYGLRFTSAFGGKTDFITADAKLTSGKTGLGVLFSDNILANFDTLSFGSYQINAINASIYLNYAITSKLEIEFNIDAIGFTFGAERTADYNSSKRLSSPNTLTQQRAKPTAFNLLLTSDNDIGSLNSEILIKYWFKPNWGLKAGGSYLFTEYTTNNKLFLNNDRFRNKFFVPMIGLVYTVKKP
ncbi:MAG: hypothetical protein MUC81_06545 [Bacteroidia bacterium]|jgi:hypothetical protein|nr:hypothetical protein [Bacteroidia bacterium]